MWVPSSLTSWCMTSSILWSGPNSSVAGTSAPDNISLWDVVCRSIWKEKKSPMSAKCHCPFHLLFQNQIIAIESCSRISCEINKACSTANVKVVNFYFSDKWSFIIHRIAIFPAICILVKDLKKSFQYAHLPIRPPGGTWVVHNA